MSSIRPEPETEAYRTGGDTAGPVANDTATASVARGVRRAATEADRVVHDLLRRRLRVACAVLSFVFGALFVVQLAGVGDPAMRSAAGPVGLAVLAAIITTTATSAVLITARPGLSLRALRRLEVLNFSLIAAHAVHFRYAALTGAADPANQDLTIKLAAAIAIIVEVLTIAYYGVFIPNTWRRCLTVCGAFVALLLATTIAAGAASPAVAAQMPFLLGVSCLDWLTAVVLAGYGSFRISTLQTEVIDARRVGQYTLRRRLGAGGMGEVYLADHALLRRPSAVKLIRPERVDDPSTLLRFEREVQATAALTHLNTVQIYDYGLADDGSFYYVMEYLPGLTLDQLVNGHGPLPAARAIHLLRQICGALGEAHAVGLIHRDVKPGNIMVCERGGVRDVAKLLDFGLVLPPSAGPDGEKLTREGAVAGTPAYMSPEQADGHETLDARSDIYSVGALAYFLLTGQPPFAGRSAIKMLAAHLYEPPQPLTTHRSDIPADLEAVVLRCLAKAPADRFADTAAFEGALAACRDADRWSATDAAAWWGSNAAPMRDPEPSIVS